MLPVAHLLHALFMYLLLYVLNCLACLFFFTSGMNDVYGNAWHIKTHIKARFPSLSRVVDCIIVSTHYCSYMEEQTLKPNPHLIISRV